MTFCPEAASITHKWRTSPTAYAPNCVRNRLLVKAIVCPFASRIGSPSAGSSDVSCTSELPSLAFIMNRSVALPFVAVTTSFPAVLGIAVPGIGNPRLPHRASRATIVNATRRRMILRGVMRFGFIAGLLYGCELLSIIANPQNYRVYYLEQFP